MISLISFYQVFDMLWVHF